MNGPDLAQGTFVAIPPAHGSAVHKPATSSSRVHNSAELLPPRGEAQRCPEAVAGAHGKRGGALAPFWT